MFMFSMFGLKEAIGDERTVKENVKIMFFYACSCLNEQRAIAIKIYHVY